MEIALIIVGYIVAYVLAGLLTLFLTVIFDEHEPSERPGEDDWLPVLLWPLGILFLVFYLPCKAIYMGYMFSWKKGREVRLRREGFK